MIETGKIINGDCSEVMKTFPESSIDSNTKILPYMIEYSPCIKLRVSSSRSLGENVQNNYTDAYKWVEEQGIAINEKLFDKYFEPTWKARSIKDGKKRKFYISENLKDAAWKWWDTKGQIPADDIAKEFQVGTKELTLYLQAQIFQHASTGTLSDNPDFFNAYYEAYHGKPSEQHFF